MSGSFKTYPKSILSHNSADFDQSRVDRYGNTFRTLEQHISFKDELLEVPIESIYVISPEDNQEKTKDGPDKNKKKSKDKHCYCLIQ